jgi:hypothetical protein
MPKFSDLDARVLVDGTPLPEYAESKTVDAAGVTIVSCWVPSEAGKVRRWSRSSVHLLTRGASGVLCQLEGRAATRCAPLHRRLRRRGRRVSRRHGHTRAGSGGHGSSREQERRRCAARDRLLGARPHRCVAPARSTCARLSTIVAPFRRRLGAQETHARAHGGDPSSHASRSLARQCTHEAAVVDVILGEGPRALEEGRRTPHTVRCHFVSFFFRRLIRCQTGRGSGCCTDDVPKGPA